MMSNIGAIHISEISPTLARLERDLGLELRSNTLGSVGKKEFSGDIDVAVVLDDGEITEFIKHVGTSLIVENVSRGPLVVISKVKIQNYQPDLSTDQLRTGFVQVDYMIDPDPIWLKTFYHSPSDTESKYKGAHRNIVIGALTKHVNPRASRAYTADGRSLSVDRYMFSSRDGLVRVVRNPVIRKDQLGFTKKHVNTMVGGPWKTADTIATTLGLGTAADLNSFETVFSSIERNHGPIIAKKVAIDMSNDQHIRALGIPSELEKYL
jgi:hypothetical protein